MATPKMKLGGKSWRDNGLASGPSASSWWCSNTSSFFGIIDEWRKMGLKIEVKNGWHVLIVKELTVDDHGGHQAKKNCKVCDNYVLPTLRSRQWRARVWTLNHLFQFWFVDPTKGKSHKCPPIIQIFLL